MEANKLMIVAASCLALAAGAAPFGDGDRVVFWGDSITHGGSYVKMLADFYLTRYPDRAVRFYNAGDRKSTRLNSSHRSLSRMPSSA